MIILTGASGGIGSLLIKHLAKYDKVIGLYNKSSPKIENVENVNYVSLDLNSANEINSFFKKYSKSLSNITIVHCAAIKKDNIAVSFDMHDWDNLFNINLKGNFLLNQCLIKKMIEQSWGRIIHISSKGAENGEPGTVAYSASKTALFGMSKVLSKEYARFNITSNIISLGAFNTGMYSVLDKKTQKDILQKIPSKKLGEINNIANAINFLILSDYVNGSVITIDGGV
jgi:3-oxoacyl-[acyl-carrier protein] reductase